MSGEVIDECYVWNGPHIYECEVLQRKPDRGMSLEHQHTVRNAFPDMSGGSNVASNIAGELWHKRLCHMSQKEMRKLAEDNLIPEVKNVQLEKCTDCLRSKTEPLSDRDHQ